MRRHSIEQLIEALAGPLSERDRAMLFGRKSATRSVAAMRGAAARLPAPPPPEQDITLRHDGRYPDVVVAGHFGPISLPRPRRGSPLRGVPAAERRGPGSLERST